MNVLYIVTGPDNDLEIFKNNPTDKQIKFVRQGAGGLYDT